MDVRRLFLGEVGGWVGGWLSYYIHRKVEENEAVRMRCWTLWVGGWEGGWDVTGPCPFRPSW